MPESTPRPRPAEDSRASTAINDKGEDAIICPVCEDLDATCPACHPAIPSGRTPAQVCRDAADYFDLLDHLTPHINIKGGQFDGKNLADILGHEDEVQADLRAVADWVERR